MRFQSHDVLLIVLYSVKELNANPIWFVHFLLHFNVGVGAVVQVNSELSFWLQSLCQITSQRSDLLFQKGIFCIQLRSCTFRIVQNFCKLRSGALGLIKKALNFSSGLIRFLGASFKHLNLLIEIIIDCTFVVQISAGSFKPLNFDIFFLIWEIWTSHLFYDAKDWTIWEIIVLGSQLFCQVCVVKRLSHLFLGFAFFWRSEGWWIS